MASESQPSTFLIKYHRGGVFVRDHLSYDYEMLSEQPNVDLDSLDLASFLNHLETECTRGKVMRPHLRKRFEGPEQLRRDLAFYALAIGYKLYYEKYKCKVTARRGKIKALQQYVTCSEDHYRILWSSAAEILSFNEGSTCKLGVDHVNDGLTIISNQHKATTEATTPNVCFEMSTISASGSVRVTESGVRLRGGAYIRGNSQKGRGLSRINGKNSMSLPRATWSAGITSEDVRIRVEHTQP
nr:transposase, Ptta/En/Spm [Tanacetum cinerariifolium]GEZ62240.1 transposase, Ptta/En/Spm [Tanacetum cinerariifolium]GEZ62259.1 transposase, Ptta/En/Spm [Tanacetum cinerariifolium]